MDAFAGMRVMQSCGQRSKTPLTFADEQRVGARVVFARARRLSRSRQPLSPEALAAADRALTLVGKGLTGTASRWGLPWVFGLIDSPDVALISGGGGAIFLTRGALSLADDEAQVAALLAVGIARVDLRQGVVHQEARRTMLCLTTSGAQELGVDLNADEHEVQAEVKINGKKVELDGYDQWEDHDAALHAASLLTFTGYDVVDGARVWSRMAPSTDSSLQGERLAASLLAADHFEGAAPALPPELVAAKLVTAVEHPGTAAPAR
jgi:predicted Zn-dependent protease